MNTEPQIVQVHSDSEGAAIATAPRRDDPIARLVQAAREGDEAAWPEIVKRYNGLVAHAARRCGLSPSDAADVAQTTWMRLWECLPSLRQPERVGAWLAVTARHEALRVSRKTRRLVLMGDEEPRSIDAETPPADLDILTAERDSELWRALGGLPERCQDLLRLLIADPPLNYREISKAFGMPIGSIGPTRARCLACLRRVTKQLVA